MLPIISPELTMSRVTTPGAKVRTLLRPRPFITAISIVTFLVATSYLRNLILGSPSSSHELLLRPSAETPHCRDVHLTEDVCAFVRTNCQDEQPGLIPYLEVYYCTFGYARVAGFALLVLWLGLLFSTIGIAASDFFTPNLQTIASVLSMPENLTGVTFLALGNGSPDVFSTIMSIRSNSAALALGELVGAACFITAVVAGSIAMTREFKVEKHTFVRDLLFFIVAILFTLGFLIDGSLRFYECIFMIAYYFCYVIFVSGSHFYLTSRARRVARAEERAKAVDESLREDGQESYRDREDFAVDWSPTQTPRVRPAIDIAPSGGPSADIMPRIEIVGARSDEEQESELEHRKHIGAEISNSMRVRRPSRSRRNTLNLIRPSLVGALDLNSALERFRREEQAETRLPSSYTRRHSTYNVRRGTRGRAGSAMSPMIAANEMPPAARDRAVSHTGNITAPAARAGDMFPADMGAEVSATSAPSSSDYQRGPSSKKAFKLDGNLAVPPVGQPSPRPGHATERTHTGQRSLSPTSPLEIPSRRSTSSVHSETLTPFPGFSDSPIPMTPTSESGYPQPQLPLLSTAATIINNDRSNLYDEDGEDGNHRRQTQLPWWPYSILPPPSTIAATLFPTLQNWSEKGAMDAFVSALSVPSVFLLSITLPVVDTRGPDLDEDSECTRLTAGIEASRGIVDTEWDEFRRHKRMRSRGSSVGPSMAALSPMSAYGVSPRDTHSIPKLDRRPDQQIDVDDWSADETDSSEELMGWNKWQVLLQVLMGPPFAAFMITSLLLGQPPDVTVAAIKWSMVASVALFLTALLTTKEGQRPRFHSLFCFPGFFVSVAWIAAIAGEVVGALKAIGVIWSISEAILGLTIFAAGNSVGDWVSNYTIARLGSPVMAFSGCIGGPMLNILLGMGSGGLIGMASKEGRKKHGGGYSTWEPYRIHISGSLVVSAGTLLITLVSLLLFVPRNGWVFSRRLGMGLIALWCVGTGVNLVIEATGLWSEFA